MPSPASEETVDEPAWAEPAAPLEAASVVELEAAAEEVAAAELAELVAAARLRGRVSVFCMLPVTAEAEVPVAVAEEGGSARARRHTRRVPGWSRAPGSLRIASRARRSASPAKACPASAGSSSSTLDSGSATLRIGVFDSPRFHGSMM